MEGAPALHAGPPHPNSSLGALMGGAQRLVFHARQMRGGDPRHIHQPPGTPAPRIPTARGGPLWAAFSAWHSTPNKCERGPPAPYTCLSRPYLGGMPLRAAFSAWHSTPTNVGRHGTAPPAHRGLHIQLSAPRPSGEAYSLTPPANGGPLGEVPRGERLAHASVVSTSSSPTHHPVGKRTPLPHALVGTPLGEYREGRAFSHVPLGNTGRSPLSGLARLRLAASSRSRTYPSPSDVQAAQPVAIHPTPESG